LITPHGGFSRKAAKTQSLGHRFPVEFRFERSAARLKILMAGFVAKEYN
jgi:hypothetical protein